MPVMIWSFAAIGPAAAWYNGVNPLLEVAVMYRYLALVIALLLVPLATVRADTWKMVDVSSPAILYMLGIIRRSP